jgi:hypothetical protein
MTDEDLRALLDDAVAGVEPTDRLVAVRQQTRRTARDRRRRWVGGGAALAAVAAASVVTVALVTGSPAPQRAADPAAPAAPTDPTDPGVAATVYYVGPGPSGPDAPDAALYREHVESASPLDALMQAPSDPDYRTRWPAGSLTSYEVGPDAITVTAADSGPVTEDLAAEQLVRTLQEAERTTLPVELVTGDSGSTLSLTLEPSDDLSVLSHMSIDEPREGATFASGTSFTVTGRGNSFEAGGGCFLRGDGYESDPYPAVMRGWIEPRLYPWRLEVDLTDVPPGTYTLSCITDDPTGGTDGRGTDTDTRTIVVE